MLMNILGVSASGIYTDSVKSLPNILGVIRCVKCGHVGAKKARSRSSADPQSSHIDADPYSQADPDPSSADPGLSYFESS